MRQILIDHARTRQAAKRGGHVVPLSLKEDLIGARAQDAGLLALDEALERLFEVDPRNVQASRFSCFCELLGRGWNHGMFTKWPDSSTSA